MQAHGPGGPLPTVVPQPLEHSRNIVPCTHLLQPPTHLSTPSLPLVQPSNPPRIPWPPSLLFSSHLLHSRKFPRPSPQHFLADPCKPPSTFHSYAVHALHICHCMSRLLHSRKIFHCMSCKFVVACPVCSTPANFPLHVLQIYRCMSRLLHFANPPRMLHTLVALDSC